LDALVERGDSADLVVLAVDARVRGDAGVAIDSATAAAFRALAARRPTLLVSLRSPYLIQELPDVGTYVLGWSGIDASQRAVAAALLGRSPITGRLPIAVPPMLERGAGLERAGAVAALAGPALDSISTVIASAIGAGVTPGAVVAVGTSRGAPWIGAFGRTDWDPDAPPVTDSTVYDLASLTKVVGTTTAVMRLVDQGRMELDAPLAAYLPEWPAGGWRDSVTIRRLLMHQAGLAPFVRFWHPSEGGLRGRDAILAAVADVEAAYTPGTRTVYSDLGAILLGAAVEAVADTSLDAYLEMEVWRPLGMDDTGFTPLAAAADDAAALRARLDRIAPTEQDTVLRMTHVHGEVHDENAWAMGGVAGHAGLFSTAPDLARFARMLLRAGRDGQSQVIDPATVQRFARRQPGTERALGWDAAAGTSIAGPLSPLAFGHTGFTGTSLWIDPARDLYVVLLTNRVNPTREQGGIQELRRTVNGWAVQAVEGGVP
ncbi:MAG: serine hydrolase, partial [Gemmatimonadota bacterium]